jgi:cytidylate kinase
MAVITISREIYSDGSHIGEEVAEALGYHFADKNTIEKVFAEHSIFQFKEVYNTVLGFWERFDDMKSTTMRFLNQVILALAHHGNMVIMGRGAFSVLWGFAGVLNVRIQAPFAIRAQRLMEKERIADIDQASLVLKERDRTRAEFIKSFFKVQWVDALPASAFDLVIDTGKVPSDMAIRWLIEAHEALKQTRAGGQTLINTIEVDPVLVGTVSEVLGCKMKH